MIIYPKCIALLVRESKIIFGVYYKSYYGISPRTFREQQKTKSQGE